MNARSIGSLQQRAAQMRAQNEARSNAPVSGAQANRAEEYRGAGPTGAGLYLVAQGDCISSIAMDKGYFWETLWNDPGNAALKLARKNPNALLPGDRVTLPVKNARSGAGQTEMRHRFVRRGEPTWLVIKLVDVEGKARRNLEYTIEIDDVPRAGMTDGDGVLRERIAGMAQTAVLRIDGDAPETYRLKLGGVDPVREVSGMQARLNNLGYGCGAVDGKFGPRTLGALNRFRADTGIQTSGRVDEATLARLESAHDQMQTVQKRPAPEASDRFEDESDSDRG